MNTESLVKEFVALLQDEFKYLSLEDATSIAKRLVNIMYNEIQAKERENVIS